MSDKEPIYTVERESKVYGGGSENSVRATVPEAIAILLHLRKGDKIRWVGKVSEDGGLVVEVSKVALEKDK